MKNTICNVSKIHILVVLFLAVFFQLLLVCNKASANGSLTPWQDFRWKFRKEIYIDNSNNSNALTDYQIQISVDYNSNMQADFDDIRFADEDGKTALVYWLESKTDSTSAVFWVKVPNIAASSTRTLYVYYGNSLAVSTSNSNNTFDFFDNLNSLAGYSTAGSGSWNITNDQAKGPVVIVNTLASDSSLYKSVTLPTSFVSELYVKDVLNDNSGSWAGPLIDMEDTDSWYRPGFSEASGLQLRDNNNGTFTNYAQSPTATTSANTWYKTKTIVKNATGLNISKSITSQQLYCTQGLATDGTYIYSSGTAGTQNGLAKYDRSGNLITSVEHLPANEHYGGMEVVGSKLYVIIFDHITNPTVSKTMIFSYNLDLSEETFVADISADVGNGGNALAYRNSYWIVGETGGSAYNFNQHFFVFDDSWNKLKTIQSPYYEASGAQEATFKNNLLYVTQHTGILLIFAWNEQNLNLTLSDAMDLNYYRDEGIAYDSINDIFYVQSVVAAKIEFANFIDLATKRAIFLVPHQNESHGVVFHEFTPRMQNYFGIGAYRNAFFSQLLVRKYAFPEPVVNLGSITSLNEATFDTSNFFGVIDDWLKSSADLSGDEMMNSKDLGIMFSRWN